MASAILDARARDRSLWYRRQIDIIRMSALRQIKSRYRGTLLGVIWSFANPIFMTALYTTLFGTAFSSYYEGSVARYVFSAFIAVVIVTFFSQATGEALVSVVANGSLLNKIAVDPEIFPVAAVAANAFQQAITTFPLVIIMTAALTHDPVRVILAPVMLCALLALVTGFGLALAALFVFFRDLSHLWAVLSFVFWITSPVFYPAALVPERVRPLVEINPVGLSITAMREVALGTGPIHFRLLAACVIVSLSSFVVGHLIFRSQRARFMDLL